MSAAKQPIWDLPVRLFHWSLAALILFSWWTAENEELDLHIASGLAILTLLVFRLLWGIFGSSTAQFRRFIRPPREVIAYIRDSEAWKGIGHNPLGALSILAMIVVLKLQVATGLLNADDDGLAEGPLSFKVSESTVEFAHEFHELLWNALLALIFLHVAAILYYRVFRKKDLITPMITGSGEVDPAATPMQAGRWWVALLCLVGGLLFTRLIVAIGG